MNIDKRRVAQRFAKASQSYTQHAIVQKQICQQLIQLMQQYLPATDFERVFEIGCGSGNLTQLILQELSVQQLILNDLYPQVQQHFTENNALHWHIGDIEQLDFPQNLALIVSSSALQWMSDIDAIFKQCTAALNQNGYFCFSSFGQKNLQEIKALTGQGLKYLEPECIAQKLESHGFEIIHFSEQLELLDFSHPKQILQHLKATGVTATASHHRWTKQSLQQFYFDYQQFSNVDQQGQISYRLTYHPIYCIARRTP